MRRIAPQQYCIAPQQKQVLLYGYTDGGCAMRGLRERWRGERSGGAQGRKKEAARRRPESREETPKEGMCGNRRTGTNVAPNAAKARTQSQAFASRTLLRCFCNSQKANDFVALRDFVAVSTSWRCQRNVVRRRHNNETCLLCK